MHHKGNITGFYLPPITDNAFRLILLLISSFLMQWIVATFFYSGNQNEIMMKHSLFFMGSGYGPSFHPAQLLTHILLHAPGFAGLINVLFVALFFYFFGSELERQWGGFHFLRFVLFSALGGIIFACLLRLIPGMIQRGFYGPDASISAILIAYAMLWPNRTVHLYFFIPIKMKNLILGGAVVYGIWSLVSGNMEMMISMAGGALSGAFYLYYYAKKGMQKHASEGYYSTGSTGRSSYTTTTTPKQTLKEKLTDYTKKKRLRKKQEEIDFRIRVKHEVDRLLDKISTDGMSSLSKKEKDFLDKASKMF